MTQMMDLWASAGTVYTMREGMRGKAFTLIEAAVVLAIVGIMIAVGAVAYKTVFTGSADQMAGQALAVAQTSVRKVANENSYAFPVQEFGSTILKTGGMKVLAGIQSVAPEAVSSLYSMDVSVSFPQGSTTTSKIVGLAVQAVPTKCHGLVDRTLVSGDQVSSFTSDWDVAEGTGCMVSPECLARIEPRVQTQSSYKVALDDPMCDIGVLPTPDPSPSPTVTPTPPPPDPKTTDGSVWMVVTPANQCPDGSVDQGNGKCRVTVLATGGSYNATRHDGACWADSCTAWEQVTDAAKCGTHNGTCNSYYCPSGGQLVNGTQCIPGCGPNGCYGGLSYGATCNGYNQVANTCDNVCGNQSCCAGTWTNAGCPAPTYTCDSGGTLSGTSCSTYVCDSGWTLSGGSCYQDTAKSCPLGYTKTPQGKCRTTIDTVTTTYTASYTPGYCWADTCNAWNTCQNEACGTTAKSCTVYNEYMGTFFACPPKFDWNVDRQICTRMEPYYNPADTRPGAVTNVYQDNYYANNAAKCGSTINSCAHSACGCAPGQFQAAGCFNGGYTCNSGDSQSGMTCSHIGCPDGFTMISGQCSKDVDPPVEGTSVYTFRSEADWAARNITSFTVNGIPVAQGVMSDPFLTCAAAQGAVLKYTGPGGVVQYTYNDPSCTPGRVQ